MIPVLAIKSKQGLIFKSIAIYSLLKIFTREVKGVSDLEEIPMIDTILGCFGNFA